MRKVLRTAGAAMMAGGLVLAAPQAVEAALVKTEFTIAGTWTQVGASPPFGLPPNPTLSGEAIFDNSKTGLDAFVSFSLATGTRSWTRDDISTSPGAADATFTAGGLMADFYALFGGGGTSLFLAGLGQPGVAAGGINISENLGHGAVSLFCNACLTVTANVLLAPRGGPPVPEPAALAVFGAGLLGLGAARRRARRRAA